jgi:DNA repair protein RadA/Sms
MVEEVEQVQGKGQREKIKGGGAIKKPVRIEEIKQEKTGRVSTGFSEVDRVLGGGMVTGSVILIAGEPGVGKSTLLLQIARGLSEKKKILYVSGEESEAQIAIRFERLRDHRGDKGNPTSPRGGGATLGASKGEKGQSLFILSETNVDAIISVVDNVKPDVLIVDSVQTIYTDDLSGTSGSVGQVRECSVRLSKFCKQAGIPIFLVGQITKEGAIAGPKVLEHLVDVVLYFEGERFQNLRILRVTKNRFGPVDEAGIFEMGDSGLAEMTNPSEIFLGENRHKSGAVITCTLEGTRPLLVEIQALTVFTSNFNPRRVFSGLDFNRCQVILAVLQKFLNIDFSKLDVYCSVSGGLKISEPAADLAVALALVSSVRGMPFDAVCFGEIGLLGDVRAVNNMGLRAKECHRLGFKKVLSATEVKNIREILRNTN